MKPFILFALLLSLPAAAEDYERSYLEVFGDYCNGSYSRIIESGARSVAEAAAANRISTREFLSVWDRTCDFNHSLDVATQAKNNRLDLRAYLDTLSDYCDGSYSRINQSGARDVGVAVADRKIDQNDFMKVWDRTCDFGHSMRIAEKVKAGRLDLGAYQDVLGDYCNGSYSKINQSGAEEVAELVALRRLETREFMRVWDRTCDYGHAKNVAEEVKSGSVHLEAYLAALGDYCNGSYSRINQGGAHDVGRLVARGEIELRTFMRFWDGTCNFSGSLDNAKAAKRSSSRGTSDSPSVTPDNSGSAI